MSEGKILYSKKEQRYFIKLSGDLRFTSGRDFDSLLERMFKDTDMKDVMIDMSEANYLDSTMLGLLAKIANFFITKFQKKVTILSTNEDINYLLNNIGLDNVFIIVTSCEVTPEVLENIPNINSSDRENAMTILDAHRQLVNLNEKNSEVFKDVIELLEQETNK